MNMGIAQMEEIVTTVKAILKTLECPICLDLLKTPVSAGCGHFFCRECASGILQSTYRAPCPLCKRSFTRRSIQEASQRQSVIAAARVLANICTNSTEVQFSTNDTTFKEAKAHKDVSAQLKKTKVSKQENQDASSRKRKSFENAANNVKTSDNQSNSEKEVNKCNERNDNLGEEDYSSPSKRLCQDSDENDSSDDLPKLEDIFSEKTKSRKSCNVVKENEKIIEKPLSIFPTDKISAVKTYSSIHKKTKKSNSSRISFDDVANSKRDSLVVENSDIVMEEIEKNVKETHSVDKIVNKNVEAKNKVNALKNKTNEVQSDTNKIQHDSSVKVKNGNKTVKNDIIDKSKENALCLSPKTRKIGKLRRKSQNKSQNSDEINLKENAVSSEDINKESSSSATKNSKIKDCYTLNQVTLLHSQTAEKNEDCSKKQTDDPSKLIGLTDTAISVDQVTSPLGTKNLSLSKSPGWSRVKKVKKDFKMKKFTSLNVEKNSPNLSNKNATNLDQETMFTNDKSNNSVDAMQLRNEDKNLNSTNEDVIHVMESVMVAEKETNNANENVVLNNNENQRVNEELDCDMKCANNAEECNKNFVNMDCSENVPGECINASSECHIENNVNLNDHSEVRIVPSVSITSNSLICTKFAGVNDKISSHNVLKSQKIVCELKQTPSSTSDLISQSTNLISKTNQDSGFTKKENKKLLFNNPDIKQTPFSLPTPFTDYQKFHTHSAESDNFQYVEQSQQTSQIFNLDFQNPFCANIRAVVPHQPPLLMYPSTEKTKVVKRTCLTLEEIQDCFFKSTQNGSSETLCSVPFFSGLFKLHIGVSDETLNVSVLKVIDPSLETNNPPSAASVLSDKSIQASSSLFPPNEVVQSSNPDSESSQPDSAHDPFPYLNKESGTNIVEKPMQVIPEFPDEDSMPATQPNIINNALAVQDEPILSDAQSSPKHNAPKDAKESKNMIDDICMDEDNLNMSEIIHFPSNSANKSSSDKECSNSPKSIPEAENCEEFLPEKNDDFNKSREFLNKVCTEEAVESLPKTGMKQSPSDENKISFAGVLTKIKSCDSSLSSDTNSSKLEQNDFVDDSACSGEDESLKKLQQCIRKERITAKKKQSRLSLKKKSSFKRIHLQESSDESDSENSTLLKEKSKKVEKNVFAKPETPPKLTSIEESFSSLRELNIGEDSKKNLFSSAPAEMPSTLNSILSEDATEGNASDIILEIEDLSDKIKSLEEKLKLCGHGENKRSKADSDSEDSTDLFPQSVPPTPPNKM